MTIIASDSFASLGATTINGRTLDNAGGGAGTRTWAGDLAGNGSGAVVGDSQTRTARVSDSTARRARIRIDPNGATNNVAIGLRSGTAFTTTNQVLVLMAANMTSLRAASTTGGARTDHATTTITVPATTFWLEIELNGLVLTGRVLNNDLSVRNTVAHTFGSTPPTGGDFAIFGFFGSGNTAIFDDFVMEDGAAADTLAPTLTTPTATALSDTTASGTVSTNESNGTLYHLTTTGATATATEVKAGASQAVTATGVQTVSITGLTASTDYYTHYLHRDAAGNDSAVSTTAQYTTAAPPVTLTTNRMTNNNNSILWANETGVTLHIYDVATGDKVATKTGQTSDAAGILTVTDGSLVAGTAYRYVVVLASGAEGLDTVTAA